MLKNLLKDRKIVLGSSSPRRQELFHSMGLDFTVRPPEVDEVYPADLKAAGISTYLAKLKADALLSTLDTDEILITSDTVVWFRNMSLAKPADEKEAFSMLKALSGGTHEVITSVCFCTSSYQRLESSITKVTFTDLSDEEIMHYITLCKPFDKAGGYGIQEWIGLVGIKGIDGSYTNVVGLPTELVYSTLKEILKD